MSAWPDDDQRAPFAALVDEKRWVGWRNELRGDKLTKVPYAPNGRKAKADDPATWRTRAEAEKVRAEIVNGLGGGVGIELGDLGADQHLGGVDLDTCLADGKFADWAEEVIARFNTYGEVSPSGTGAKLFFSMTPKTSPTYARRWARSTVGNLSAAPGRITRQRSSCT